jgi:hypothetical protein
MSGFAFSYVGGSEATLTTLGSSGGVRGFDFYRVDATHLLCLTWRFFSTDTWIFVIDHSNPVTVSFGTPVNFNGQDVGDQRPTLTQLTSTDWLLCYEPSAFNRLSVSGTAVSSGAYFTGQGSFSYDSFNAILPPALWEGHTATGTFIEAQVGGGSAQFQCLGIDFNHVLMPGSLAWIDPVVGGLSEPKWWVLDLSTTGVQPVAVFDTTSGFYPNANGAAQVGPGAGYWWAWDSAPPGDFPSGLRLNLVETDGGSISMSQVTGYDFNSLLSFPVDNAVLTLADDGNWWLGVATNTQLESSWTEAAPFVVQTTMVRVNATSASTLSYLGESDWTSKPTPLVRVWPFDSGRICNQDGILSWQITDTHLRVENHNTSYKVFAPHHLGAQSNGVGLSHGRMVFVYVSGTSLPLYAATYQETALPPSPDFGVDMFNVTIGTPILFNAEDLTHGHDTKEQTRDSYWHPVLGYRWEWDDGTADIFTSSPTISYTYNSVSTTHVTGSQTADTDINPGLIGEVGYFLPLLRARNSVGWSYAQGGWVIQVLPNLTNLDGFVVASHAYFTRGRV